MKLDGKRRCGIHRGQSCFRNCKTFGQVPRGCRISNETLHSKVSHIRVHGVSAEAVRPRNGGFMRSAVIGFLVLIALLVLLAISGCHGGGIGPVANVTVTPASLSLSPGEVIGLTSTATDKNGNTVANTTFTYAVTGSGITASNSGLVCAGTWDSVT